MRCGGRGLGRRDGEDEPARARVHQLGQPVVGNDRCGAPFAAWRRHLVVAGAVAGVVAVLAVLSVVLVFILVIVIILVVILVILVILDAPDPQPGPVVAQ